MDFFQQRFRIRKMSVQRHPDFGYHNTKSRANSMFIRDSGNVSENRLIDKIGTIKNSCISWKYRHMTLFLGIWHSLILAK